MTTIRWGRALTEPEPAVPKIRWGRVLSDGTAPAANPKIRWGRVASDGVASVTVAAIASIVDIEPGTLVTITASLVGGGAADSWTWRPISGPSVGITGTGETVTVVAPSHLDGCTVVIGVRATKDGTVSPERSITLTVLPQLSWRWTGTTLVPRVRLRMGELAPGSYGEGAYGQGMYGSV